MTKVGRLVGFRFHWRFQVEIRVIIFGQITRPKIVEEFLKDNWTVYSL